MVCGFGYISGLNTPTQLGSSRFQADKLKRGRSINGCISNSMLMRNTREGFGRSGSAAFVHTFLSSATIRVGQKNYSKLSFRC